MKIITTTIDKKNAEKIALTLLKEKLAACVNIVPCDSVYLWKGKIEKSKEFMMIIKTKNTLAERTAKRICEMHSYKMPVVEIINVEKSSKGTEEWIKEVTK